MVNDDRCGKLMLSKLPGRKSDTMTFSEGEWYLIL